MTIKTLIACVEELKFPMSKASIVSLIAWAHAMGRIEGSMARLDALSKPEGEK